MGRQRFTAEQRRREIVELTERRSYLRPLEIAAELGVSPETVRRDLLLLEESGQLKRVHGGAMSKTVHTSEPDRTSRSVSDLAQKQEVGRIVNGLIQDGDIVFMDVGTTVEAAASLIRADFVGTVVTNSIAVGTILNNRPDIEVHVLGGILRVGELTTYGPDALLQLSTFNASVAFIGSGGVSLEQGLTDYSLEDIAIKRLMVERSSRSYVLATANKFGVQAKRVVCGFSAVDGIITDGALAEEICDEYRAAGVAVLTPTSFAQGSDG